MSFRIEKDTLGAVEVPESAYWGAQTQRSLSNFKIGYSDRFPKEFIYAYALLKQGAACANHQLGLLDKEVFSAISKAAIEIRQGQWDEHFPLVVWQTGSGTQTNMNLNEVIARRAGELLKDKSIHPNDDVNKGQSSNDTFPTAMHLASALQIQNYVLPRFKEGLKVLKAKKKEFESIVKIGRTHLMDATPLTLGQEFSAYEAQFESAIKFLEVCLENLLPLPLGGTAVGTGLNAHPEFGKKTSEFFKKETGLDFRPLENKFSGIAAHDVFVALSGALNTFAAFFMKLANDIRLLGSGPRSGLAELLLPANEPGSSIMPGKVNPTQCEALSMVAAQVMGAHVSITVGAASGHLQLNAFKPLIIWNVLNSSRLLADAYDSFSKNCLQGLKANESQIKAHLDNSLMLVTALNSHIGYDNAAKIAKKAYAEGTSLKQAALELKLVSEEQFDQWVKPENMVGL